MLNPASRITHHASRITLHAPRAPRPSERGVALVITLVLLTVITFMAVTFLVVSSSQHGSVTTETEQAIARLAADTARERAIAQLLAPIMAWTNEFNYGLLVSTNYINPAGFTNGVSSPLNVNYDFDSQTRSPLSAAEKVRNIANLLYDPRPPVYIVTNAFGSNDFRFYLDLNRNGHYDPSGLQPEVVNDAQGHPNFINDPSGNFVPYQWPPPSNIRSNFFVGDPEWIGALRYPEFAHAADNQFVYRYAYLAVPAGQTLDINYIHNQALRPAKTKLDPNGPDFLRNQGVGTFEINLAGFLYDLNTNLYAWGGLYRYDPSGVSPAAGNAFADAGALLAYRYAMNPVNKSFTLASVSQLFGGLGATAFGRDFLDGYSGGPVMTGTSWPQAAQPDSDSARVTTPWAGADNANHFYTTQDLFDKTKTAVGLAPHAYTFTDRLLAVGTNNSSYDRYTFYRLLSQLDTDSAPEPSGKMNLNYCNVDTNGYIVPNMATNFIPWTPVQFFTNAAIRLLADAGYTVGASYSTSNLLVLSSNYVNGLWLPVTNLHIPLWPTNFYTPSVQRFFQLAANIYDATTNRSGIYPSGIYPYLPSVFRPVFANVGGTKTASQVSIIGYEEVMNASVLTAVMVDLSDSNSRGALKARDDQHMVYNIPLVIGAKKGFPNFNEFAMQTLVQVSRKLQFTRQNGPNTPISQTNQMFLVGISNVFAVEAWNSYVTNFSRPLRLYYMPDISVVMTNETGKTLNPYQRYQPPMQWTDISKNAWPGYNRSFESYSFQIPLSTNLMFLTNSTYLHASGQFVPAIGTFEKVSPAFFIPHWWLNVKARLRFAVVDITNPSATRIVDYVNLADQTLVNLTDTLMQGGQCGGSWTPDGAYGSLWCTNHYPTPNNEFLPTFGVLNQIQVGLGMQPAYGQAVWNSAMNSFPAGMEKPAAIDSFRNQFELGPLFSHPVGTVFYPSNTFAAPFQPVRSIFLVTSWQANDPLVHYTVGDLTSLTRTNLVLDNLPTPAPLANLGHVNLRYEPWGGNPAGSSSSTTKFDLRVKDPLMLQSDSWDFPTNKLPNVGWLGRVHRGTPWQTVYLKSPGMDLPTWQTWTGNGLLMTNAGQTGIFATNTAFFDAFLTQPTNDWRIVDLFTSALNDNATRGQLSINQANLAAWSAVLSGVMVLANDANGNLYATNIQPAGVYDPLNPTTWSPVVQLVNRINEVRYYTNSTRHVFSRLGDLLAVPELTVASPFLNTNGTATLANSALNDAAYERLPQQILGLLKCDHTPRFVIYAFGQTLKPAPHAIVQSGPFSGLCTNYQIVAEAATRTVVRFEGVQRSLPGILPPPITTLHPVFESFNVLPPD
jgi:hypothetical protein